MNRRLGRPGFPWVLESIVVIYVCAVEPLGQNMASAFAGRSFFFDGSDASSPDTGTAAGPSAAASAAWAAANANSNWSLSIFSLLRPN